MQGHLKAVGLIDQCTRCFSLRSPSEEECPTCRELFDERTTSVQKLLLNDISSDTSTEGYVALATNTKFHA